MTARECHPAERTREDQAVGRKGKAVRIVTDGEEKRPELEKAPVAAPPAPPTITPRLLRSPRDFEAAAADWMKAWGLNDVRLTGRGADGGIDVEAQEAVAQVKAWMAPVGRPEIQQLKGAAHDGRTPLFFSLSEYTTAARQFADEASVALFRFTGYNGEVEAENGHGKSFIAQRTGTSAAHAPGGKRWIPAILCFAGFLMLILSPEKDSVGVLVAALAVLAFGIFYVALQLKR